MLKINEKTFLNIQEAVQWLMDNNALPFQCTANYAANTEIGLGTIVNPTMAKVRIGSLIFFADSKVSTVTGITTNGFIVSDKYNDLVDDVVYISDVTLLGNGHLIVYFSNGTSKDVGQIKEVTGFTINSQQHLVVSYNDGTSVDLGAIFNGNITISGTLSVTGDATIGGDISGSSNILATGKFLGAGVEIKTIDDIEGQGYIDVLKPLRVSALTSENNEIAAQKPVVEVMAGYSANVGEDIADYFWSFTPSYVSACKNGNKLTLVAFFKLKKIPASSGVYVDVIDFTLPYAIANLIEPITIGGYGYVDQKEVACFYGPSSFIKCPARIGKTGNVLHLIIDTTNFVVDTDYLIRYEATFLLSSNLIP